MGITNFTKWLVETYPQCVLEKFETFEYIYIDLNCLLHMVITGCMNENMLRKRLCSRIDVILKNAKCLKKIILAMDGPAPIAKILMQRERRLKVLRTIESNSDLLDAINPLYFSPGTKFMNSLKDKLLVHVKKYTDCNIDVSILDGHGESELKLINELIINNNIKPKSNHLIMSTDADIIIMAYHISNINIPIFINNYKFVISINKLHSEHIKIVGKSLCSGTDFMILSMMMGNDYLPKFESFKIETIWEIYKIVIKNDKRGCLIDGRINLEFLIKLFRNIVFRLPKRIIKHFNIVTHNIDLYENYYDGLIWCIQMYSNQDVAKYDYKYIYNSLPHPLGFLIYLESMNKIKDNIVEKKYNIIDVPSNIYAALILPKYAYNLIDGDISEKFDEKFKYLYEEEFCQQCIKYDTDKYIKNKINKDHLQHKLTHKIITIDDIKNIVTLLAKKN